MTRSSIRAALLTVVFCGIGLPAWAAQMETRKPVQLKPPKIKVEKFKGEVLHANAVQITVRSRENARVVRTFSLSPKMREQMQKIIARGGYQYGDKVEVRYEAGRDLAIKIKGKPSRSR